MSAVRRCFIHGSSHWCAFKDCERILWSHVCLAVVILVKSPVMQVQGHVDDALAKGAKALTGGKRPDMQAPYDKGYFFEPTVLSDCTIDMKVSKVSDARSARQLCHALKRFPHRELLRPALICSKAECFAPSLANDFLKSPGCHDNAMLHSIMYAELIASLTAWI